MFSMHGTGGGGDGGGGGVCVSVPPLHGIYPYLTWGKWTWVNEMTSKPRFWLIHPGLTGN